MTDRIPTIIKYANELTPHPDNYNHHPKGQITQLAESLTTFGQFKNIVAWTCPENMTTPDGVELHEGLCYILAGHGLWLAAMEAGLDQLEIKDYTGLSYEMALTLLMVDNAAPLGSEPIAAQLAKLLERTKALTADRPGLVGMLEALRQRAGVNGKAETGSTEEYDPGEVPDLLAPFPYFGGKSRVASKIWQRLGQVQNYVEPFCGSAAVLLACPLEAPTVTLNDADGFIANFWRAVAYAPADVAKWVDWPVNENDLFARHIWLIKQRGELVQSLETNPDWYDAKIAGWWCWGACAWIGTGWCSGEGPWTAVDGKIMKNGELSGDSRQLPHLTGNGQGVNRKLPSLSDNGYGVNRKIPEIVGGRGGERLGLGVGFEGQTCEAITSHLQVYIQALSDKLRRARVACGDWQRVTTPSVTTRHGLTAVLLDPPYGEGEQEYSAGGNQDKGLTDAVWKWAIENGNDPNLRIGVCGYEDGRETPAGWSVLKWKAPGGYGSTEAAVENSRRETIWFSPYCLNPAQPPRLVTAGE